MYTPTISTLAGGGRRLGVQSHSHAHIRVSMGYIISQTYMHTHAQCITWGVLSQAPQIPRVAFQFFFVCVHKFLPLTNSWPHDRLASIYFKSCGLWDTAPGVCVIVFPESFNSERKTCCKCLWRYPMDWGWRWWVRLNKREQRRKRGFLALCFLVLWAVRKKALAPTITPCCLPLLDGSFFL